MLRNLEGKRLVVRVFSDKLSCFRIIRKDCGCYNANSLNIWIMVSFYIKDCSRLPHNDCLVGIGFIKGYGFIHGFIFL